MTSREECRSVGELGQCSHGHPSSVRPTNVRIRLPLAVRLYVCAVAAVWCGAFGAAAVAAVVATSPVIVIPVLALAFGASVGARILRLSVATDGDELVIRNHSSTRRVPRRDIREFEIAAPRTPIPLGRTVQATLTDGSAVVIDVLARPHLLPSSQRRLHQQLEQLTAWLAA